MINLDETFFPIQRTTKLDKRKKYNRLIHILTIRAHITEFKVTIRSKNNARCSEFGGARVREVHSHGKSIGRSRKRPYKRGALVREVPAYKGFTVFSL